MIQRAPARDNVAEEIVACITAAMRPWRIVLFGSRARGGAKEESDYDLYVEIDATDDRELREIQSKVRSLLRGTGATFDVHARRPETIERRRDDPGTIEWDVAREGIVLYADPAAADVRPAKRVREPTPELPESFHEWMDTAERDLRHRQLLQSHRGVDDYSPEICWLSHQTIEKRMKALLVSRRVRPKRTHDLMELLAALRGAGLKLDGLDADCELLTKYAVDPWYAAGLDLGEGDAQGAVAAAERIIAAVREYLPPRLH